MRAAAGSGGSRMQLRTAVRCEANFAFLATKEKIWARVRSGLRIFERNGCDCTMCSVLTDWRQPKALVDFPYAHHAILIASEQSAAIWAPRQQRDGAGVHHDVLLWRTSRLAADRNRPVPPAHRQHFVLRVPCDNDSVACTLDTVEA
eukprot:SAG31_NODE_21389_length_551_cov_0.566372_1_plen_146_part_01